MTCAAEQESGCSGNCNQGRDCTCAGEDPIGAVRGTVNRLLLAIPVWAVILLVCWWRS